MNAMEHMVASAQVPLLRAKRKETDEEKERDSRGFRLGRQLGFRMPQLYDPGMERLKDFMDGAMKKSKERGLFYEDSVRTLWAGVFMNNSLKEAVECLQILRKEVDYGVEMGGQSFLCKVSSDWHFCDPRERDVRTLANDHYSPLLRFEKNQTVVVVNMVGGMPAAPLVLETMQKLERKPAAYVLVGYSWNGETEFMDGSRMAGQLFIPPKELERLARNKDKVALVVDDSHCSGTGYRGGYRRGYARLDLRKLSNSPLLARDCTTQTARLLYEAEYDR